ncbi:glutathione S-transferase family protein [Aquabacterium lacunae]|uniref:Glutathione S-transferase family protein n=1 Tax=Aquabacterium lacunae TaxID=2528630 RepID=A0A4Q9GUV5_9BURK|nr:glutathione S-transferase family protein [Aquabacterium lacunae]TBO27917.1 glutathione S-transferase family protein [Aquabacterium lacunae]
MLVLHTFGPAFGLPDLSPFVLKTMIQLKMAGLPFEVRTGSLGRAPKGKLPFLQDGDTVVADSTFIRWHIERTRGIDLDAGLSAAQRGQAWALEKMLDDHLYWLAMHNRWLEPGNFERGPKVFLQSVLPGPLKWFVPGLVQGKFRRTLQLQGIGRHTDEERAALVRRDIEALAQVLGDKPCLMGDQPTAVDAMAAAGVMTGLLPEFTGPIRDTLLQQPRLLAYAQRMQARFFPEIGQLPGCPEVLKAA